ncbi:hemolysin family protein [Anaerococcus sp.]|uniref:hemolysin family protein n=1 Tax=Anaerococcus sp. TaxID=1872515 RepID=UPI002A91CB6A|nr:hemolysin family protein [Anaerococcus sp.]MDY6127514.1 hemolysin family protein [Anaerococcus sp.]
MDDGHSIGTILIMLLLVVLSAGFSAAETAFTSLNKNRLKVMEKQGNRRAKQALKLFDNYSSLLSTVLVGNNIVNITLAGMSTLLFIDLIGPNGSTVSTIVITIIVLVFCEVSPKSFAKERAESVALALTPALIFLNKLFYPINWLFEKWKLLLSRKIKHETLPLGTTDDEILSILDEATDQGSIDSIESDLIRNAIEFNDRRISDILVPRTQIKAINRDASIEEITEVFMESEFSRLPVYDENLDDIIGVLHYKDFMSHVRIQHESVIDNIQPVLFVAPGRRIHDVLQTLQKNKRHIAIVTDEYGGTMGLITMEDILEELVGEIFDETDEVDELISKIDEKTYIVSTSVELDDFFEYFGIVEESDSNTLSGWINEKLNAIPKVGDRFETDKISVLVIQADVNRAIQAKITKKSQ